MVLRTASGTAVTVSTSDATEITRLVNGTVGDITNGAHVLVRGDAANDGKTIAAASVGIMPGAVNPARGLDDRIPALRGHANGTVADAGDDGFTVVRSDGTRVHVTTSSSTTVTKQVDATVGDLERGKFTVAVGNADPNGTFNATSVQQGRTDTAAPRPPHELPRAPKALPGDLPRPLPSLPAALPRDLFKGLGCDARTIGTTAIFASD
jgi:hypothetical protein